MTYFLREADDRYSRQDELLRERMYPREEVEQVLERTGFVLLGAYGDLGLTPARETDERIYYIVQKRKG